VNTSRLLAPLNGWFSHRVIPCGGRQVGGRPSTRTQGYYAIVLLGLCGMVSVWSNSHGADDSSSTAPQAYRVSELWTGDGQRIPDAVLVVRDGKIESVGPFSSVVLPPECVVHDHRTLTMIPGMILAETSLAEGGADQDYAVSPEIRAIDGFDFFAPMHECLAAGITTVQLSPGVARLMPGQGSVVKVAGENLERRVLRPSESLRIMLTRAALSPPTIYEPPVGAVSEARPLLPTRPQLAGNLSGAISGLQAIFSAAQELPENAQVDLREQAVATIAEALRRKQTFRFLAQSATEIRAAIELAQQFELATVFVSPQHEESMRGVDWSNGRWRGVVLSPGVRPGQLTGVWGLEEIEDQPTPTTAWDMAAMLVSAGAEAKLALKLESDQDIPHLRYLAALFQQGGLSEEQIMNMLTSNPAQVLQVADRVGRLAVGMDADFVLLTGKPLGNTSQVEATFVDGNQVYRATREPQMRVVVGAQVYSGGEMIPDARIAVVDGKITSIGTQVSAPATAAYDHFHGAVIVPGFIDLGTSVGWGGAVSERLPLQTKLGDYLAMNDEQMAAARRGGITTGLLSSTSLPSPVVAFKLSDRPRVLQDPVAVRFEVGGNLTQTETSVRRTLQAGKAYHESWVKYESELADYQAKLKVYEAELAKFEAAKKAQEAAAGAGNTPPPQTTTNSGADAAKPDVAPNSPAPSTPGAKPDAGTKPVTETKPDAGSGPNAGTKPDAGATPAAEVKPDAGNTPEVGAPQDAAKATEPVAPTKPTEPTKPRAQEALEPYRLLCRQEIPAIVEVADALSTKLALRLFQDEFKFRTIVSGGAGLESVASEITKSGAKFITGPTLVAQEAGQAVNYPQLLAQHGVPFGFQSKAGANSASMAYVVGFAVHQGLADRDALNGMTNVAADMFGLSTVGHLKPGQDADMVVLSGPPFDPGSRILAVMIDGQWVYKREVKP
jgi:imidazolonepropionase-like amidohydrolase